MRFDLLTSKREGVVTGTEKSQFNQSHKDFEVDEIVLVKNFRCKKNKWLKAKIIRKLGSVMYLCWIYDLNCYTKRHLDQMLKCKATLELNDKGTDETVVLNDKIGYVPQSLNSENVEPSVNSDVIVTDTVESLCIDDETVSSDSMVTGNIIKEPETPEGNLSCNTSEVRRSGRIRKRKRILDL